MTTIVKTTEVSTAQARARFCELVRRAELNGEEIILTRRGKAVARLVPVEDRPQQAPKEDWVLRVSGMLADAPEVLEAIEEAYKSRQHDTPRPLHFPWDEQE